MFCAIKLRLVWLLTANSVFSAFKPALGSSGPAGYYVLGLKEAVRNEIPVMQKLFRWAIKDTMLREKIERVCDQT